MNLVSKLRDGPGKSPKKSGVRLLETTSDAAYATPSWVPNQSKRAGCVILGGSETKMSVPKVMTCRMESIWISEPLSHCSFGMSANLHGALEFSIEDASRTSSVYRIFGTKRRRWDQFV